MNLKGHRDIDLLESTSNPTVWKKIWRKFTLSCSYCPPHRAENASSWYYKKSHSWKSKKRRRQYK